MERRRRDQTPGWSARMRRWLMEQSVQDKINQRNQELENAAKEKERVEKLEWNKDGVGGDHPAWDIIIGKVDFESQLKISQQNKRLADVVATHAEYELQKFRREIQADKYM